MIIKEGHCPFFERGYCLITLVRIWKKVRAVECSRKGSVGRCRILWCWWRYSCTGINPILSPMRKDYKKIWKAMVKLFKLYRPDVYEVMKENNLTILFFINWAVKTWWYRPSHINKGKELPIVAKLTNHKLKDARYV